MIHVRLASHYVLRELADAIDCSDTNRSKRLFWKYRQRYRLDSELGCLACTVSALEKLNKENCQEIRARLKKLCTMRQLAHLNGSANLLPNRMTIR